MSGKKPNIIFDKNKKYVCLSTFIIICEAQINELAEMLGGSSFSDKTFQAAVELLNK